MAIEIAKYTCLAKKYSTWVGQQPTSTGGDKYMRGLKYKQEMPPIEEKTPEGIYYNYVHDDLKFVW